MKKRILSLAIVLAMTLSMFPVTSFAAGVQYGDIANHWAASSIKRWSEYEIVKGDNNGNFRPDASLTRGEMAKIIANALGLTDEGDTNPFGDVPDNAWYTPYVLRCYEAGIIKGDGKNAFPENTITRQEAMTIIGRMLELEPLEETELSSYTDSGDVAGWAKGYVAAMIKSGVVKGVGGNRIAPTGDMIRAAIMAILDRCVTTYINTPGTYELPEDGFVLVTCGGVTLTGKSNATVLVTKGASGNDLTFDKAEVSGTVIIQADDLKVKNKESSLPALKVLGKNVTTEDVSAPTVSPTATVTVKPTKKPSSGGGGSDRDDDSVPAPTPTPTPTPTPVPVPEDDLVVDTPKTVDGVEGIANYRNALITDAVGNGGVTLKNLHIFGDLTVEGGGKFTVRLEKCVIDGKIIMNKTRTATSNQEPTLSLAHTPVQNIEVKQTAIIKAEDTDSTIENVTASSDVYVNGDDTVITKLTVYSTEQDTVLVKMKRGHVQNLEVQSPVKTKKFLGGISHVVVRAPFTFSFGDVKTVEIPADVTERGYISCSGGANIYDTMITINSVKGADIDCHSLVAQRLNVDTELDVMPDVTGGGSPLHVHKWGAWEDAGRSCKRTCLFDSSHTKTDSHSWDDGVVTRVPTAEQEGERLYTCENCGATKTTYALFNATWFEREPVTGTAKLDWRKDIDDYGYAYNSVEIVDDQGAEVYRKYNNGTIQGTTKLFGLLDLLSQEEDKTLTLDVFSGNLLDTVDADLKIANPNNTLNVLPQADGYYRVSGGDVGYDGYVYRLIDLTTGEPVGEERYPGTKSADYRGFNCVSVDGVLSDLAPYENTAIQISQFKLQYVDYLGKAENGNDRYDSVNVTITKPVQIEVTKENLPATPSGETLVSNAEELQTALNKGGTVVLKNDIEAETIDVYVGMPATLKLNGHKLTCSDKINVTHGKSLTIDNTMAGSELATKLSVLSRGALTVKGGVVNKWIFADGAREVNLDHVKLITGTDGFDLDTRATSKVILNGGEFTGEGGYISVYFEECGEVYINDVTFSKQYLELTTFEKIEVTGCTFINSPLKLCDGTAVLADNTFDQDSRIELWGEISDTITDVTIKSGTYEGTLSTERLSGREERYAGFRIEGGSISSICIRPEGYLLVSGGTCYEFVEENGKGEVVKFTGGTFGCDPTAYVPEGYTVVKGGTAETPLWTVVKE